MQALKLYRARAVEDDFSALHAFVADYPHSGWQIALLTNLGLSYYHYGYFSKAIDAWQKAWRLGRAATDLPSQALVDRAVGELIRMHARVGHADDVATLLDAINERPVSGPATEAVDGAREGLWMMRNKPGVAFLCGPMALRNLLLSEGTSAQKVQFIEELRSGPNGFNLAEVAGFAEQAKFSYRLIFRKAGQPVPVPSVIHWKISHFAAIVGEDGPRYHVQDPTFGTDLWGKQKALLIPSRAVTFWFQPTAPHPLAGAPSAYRKPVESTAWVSRARTSQLPLLLKMTPRPMTIRRLICRMKITMRTIPLLEITLTVACADIP